MCVLFVCLFVLFCLLWALLVVGVVTAGPPTPRPCSHLEWEQRQRQRVHHDRFGELGAVAAQWCQKKNEFFFVKWVVSDLTGGLDAARCVEMADA